MRLLVTGGAGFIGANFVHSAVREHAVTVLDALTYAGSRESLAPVENDIRLVQGDITDADLVSKLVAEADAVVHFAAETHVDNALADPEPFLRANVVGTFTVLEAVRAARRAVASRVDRRGVRRPRTGFRATVHRVDAVQPVEPVLVDEGRGRLAGARVGAVLRCAARRSRTAPTTTGPYQHVEKFIPRQITNVLTGRRPKLYGNGANVRDWIHVDDHNSAVWRILADGQIGRTYLIGAEGERDNLSVMRTILRLMGRDPDDFDHVTDRAGHDLRYAIDPSPLYNELGWGPKHTDFEEGLRATIEWYRDNESWWRPLKDAVEAGYEERGQ